MSAPVSFINDEEALAHAEEDLRDQYIQDEVRARYNDVSNERIRVSTTQTLNLAAECIGVRMALKMMIAKVLLISRGCLPVQHRPLE